MDFNSSGAMRSPFSPRVRQSITGRRPIGLLSSKKNQSKYVQSPNDQSDDVIYKTPTTTIQTYGTPLPVMVTEALTFASSDVTVGLSPCGWCWVVSGRRVFAWARSPITTETSSPSLAGPHAAKELTLPQTDLAHKADLVSLFYEEGSQMPSCIGVSPEGVVRYWPSVGQETVYVDVTCELAGQECEHLGEYTRIGLLLATTTCTVVILNPTVVDGRATVTCRTLRPPSGWLGGIGRRVSFLFFGSTPAHADTKLVGTAVVREGGGGGGGGAESACVALVASGPALQLWEWDGDQHSALHEHSLRRALTEAYARAVHVIAGELTNLEVVALDVRAAGSDGLLLLVAVVNIARSPEMRYAIAHVSVAEAAAPRVTSLVCVRTYPREGEEPPRFLPLGPRALLYTSRYIALVSSTVPNDKVDFIDVSVEGDRILGAEMCNGFPLLFSTKHGVLALTTTDSLAPTPSLCESPMGSPCPSDMYDGNLSLYEIDPHEVNCTTTDACGKLKTAFLFHLRRDTIACRNILDELFPPPATTGPATPASPGPGRRGVAPLPREGEEPDVDGVLDRTVMRIATEMLDDVPAGDPRWKVRQGGLQTNIALGSSSALQIAAQLRDKQRAFSLFIDFLRATGLWQRLSLISRETGGGVLSTAAGLSVLAESLAAALALRRLHQGGDAQLIDAAIYQVVCGGGGGVAADWEEEEAVCAALAGGALSASDVCYRRVTRMPHVLRALARPTTHAHAHTHAHAGAAHAAATLALLTEILTEVHRCRTQAHSQPAPPQLGPRALLPALTDLIKYALKECAHKCEDATVRAQLCQGAGTLADLLLSEAQTLARDPHTAHLYENIRRDILRCFMEEGEIERAAVLAEKFKDFEILIELCVKSDDMERLYSYIDKYSNEGMCSSAFSWLCEWGGAGRALAVRGAGARYPEQLSAWAGVAGSRRELSALHELSRARYSSAARALTALADEETGSLQRMTTMASLAKLCLVASSEPHESDSWRSVESRLAVSDQHAALPRHLRLRHGLDEPDSRVLQPGDLLQMYIEAESGSLTEYDYKKALDLTDYIQDMEQRDELRLRVWCSSILHDDWSQCRVESPAEELHTKTFFRLVDLVHLMGGDLELLLPPLEDILTAPELAELVSDSRFHFLIKYGYECVDTTCNDNMSDE